MLAKVLSIKDNPKIVKVAPGVTAYTDYQPKSLQPK